MYAQAHQLLQWTALFRQGTTPADPEFETAVGSLRFAGPAAIEFGGQDVCDALAAVLATYWGSAEANIPRNCLLTTVKWNQIDRSGHYANEGETILTDLEGVPGGIAGKFPTQIAWATTWDTDVKRGRAARGRTYWPTAATISPIYTTVAVSEAQNKANRDIRLIRDLTLAIGPVASSTPVASVMSNIGEGVSHPITGTRVGVRLDVQRRRGKGVDEAYVTGVAPTP